MTPVILFRPNRDTKEELFVAAKYFTVYKRRTEIPTGSTVIPRYSAVPYYNELQYDLRYLNCDLVNSHGEHSWIANFEYYQQLKKFTFPSWTEGELLESGYDGPLVVKGRTNSRKMTWNKTMFAKDVGGAIKIARILEDDSYIGQQGIIFRQYVPLKTLEIGLFDLPFVNEFRFFFFHNNLLGYGFNWNDVCDCPEKAEMTQEGIAFAREVAAVAAEHVNFFVLDIAEKESGGWILVEMNCGTMSGLSGINPDTLYKNLRECYRSTRATDWNRNQVIDKGIS